MAESDMVFLAKRLETFVDLVQDPQAYFERDRDDILPGSPDHKILAAALYLLIDCYLRGEGLKFHHASKTLVDAMDRLSVIWGTIQREVTARPYLYPKLNGALGRGQAAVELDWLLDGYSKWSEGD